MKNIFLAIFVSAISLFASNLVLAEDTFTDITSSGFLIDLSNIDPVNQTTTSAQVPKGAHAITKLLQKIADFLLFFMPVIAAVSLLAAGYFYILSGGDSEKASRAKTIIKWNAIALIVALSSYAIIATIGSLLEATI